MIKFFKRLLGIKDLELNREEMDKAMESIAADIKKKIFEMNKFMDISQDYMDKMDREMADVNNKIGARIVKRKLKGWTSEHEFIELFTRIYIIDNNNPKQNKPFLVTDSDGTHDDYKNEMGPDSKMRCFMLTKLILVGYGKLEDFEIDGPERNSYKHFFGKSYSALSDYMYEFNYEKLDEGISTLNFYEI